MIEEICSAYRFDRNIAANKSLTETNRHYTLRWVMTGKLSVMLETETFLLQPGQMLLLPPDCHVSIRLPESPNMQFAVTSFRTDEDLMPSSLLCRPISLYGREQAILLDYFYTASQVFGSRDDENDIAKAGKYIHTLLDSFLQRISLSRCGYEKWILPEQNKVSTHNNDQNITLAIKDYLSSHLSANVTLDELSRQLGISKNSMMRIFRADTGMGIMEYFVQRKIDMAVRLITESDLSFRSISEQLGFQTPEYFSRVFKKIMGLTPTEFSRQRAKWQGCLASFC